MNRIYQGRASGAELIDEKGNPHPAAENWDGLNALWQHHALFQDAVNYYVVCLLALAGKDSPLWPIREKLDAHDENGHPDERMVWRPFPRRGALRSGLRDSVAKHLTPGNPQPTPEQCFAAALVGNETNEEKQSLALEELLFICSGDNPIKNQGRWMFDRFCNSDYTGSFPFDSMAAIREQGERRLKTELHSIKDAPALNAFAREIRLGWVVNLSKGAKAFESEAARSRLRKAVTHFLAAFGGKSDTEMGERVRAFLTGQKDAQKHLTELDEKIAKTEAKDLPAIPASRRGKADRVEACLLFQHFPSEFTAELLKVCFPKSDDQAGKKSQKRKDPEEVSPKEKFTQFGGDAIEMVRGSRGFIFPSFTAVAFSAGKADGVPVWIGFDVAAFKEALKAIHQIEAKGKERADKQKPLTARLEYQRQRTLLRTKNESGREQVDPDWRKGTVATKKWTAASETEESAPPLLVGDPRIARLEHLVDEELKAEYEMSEGVEVRYGLHQRTIRGFNDLRKKWNETAREAPFSEDLKAKLLEELRAFQKENPNIVGSVRLFEALLEKDNWLIWREPTAEEQRDWRKAAKLPDDAEFAKDPLQALTDERELIEEIERLSGPIRFTPADPEHSRRQFYFSDVSALEKKGRLRHDRQTLDTEIALNLGTATQPKWERRWVRIAFSAPRLLRDELNNTSGKDAAFQQAMMEALGLRAGLQKTEKGEVREARFEECAAVALMPDVLPDGSKRILLNFPIKLEDDAIARALGKAERWDSLQFGGADGESYWLRWPGTWIDEKKERKKAPPAPWWRTHTPFSILSVDLGQRDAGAFALLEATPGEPPKPQSRKLGKAEGTAWWATVRATGMLRLPGENAQVVRDGQWQEEFSGHRGRLATEAEWQEARDICTQLGLVPGKVLGDDPRFHSFPEINDRLLYALRRAQSRLARLQSWSCVDYNETDARRKEAFEKRRAAIKAEIVAALQARSAEQAKPDAEREQESPERGQWLDDVRSLVDKGAWNLVAERLKREVEREREAIKAQLVRIANRIQPLRGRRWEWALRPGDAKNHFLRQTEQGSDPRPKLLAGQRGLSLARIEQLESLRQRCQSLNRALQQNIGEPVRLGRSKRGIELPDPCPELLDRLDALKEQRVNQTAHLILAQALGVRLKPHAKNEAERAARDLHGEYERIPGREPVDFLVLENLDRYLASQGRSRSENSRLMKWCHRAILGKLKQLCEPYGLRVLETPAAYSSKFCSLTGVAGFRAVELTPDDRTDFRWKKHLDRLADPERAKKLDKEELAESQHVKRLFDQLDTLNADLLKSRPARPKWHTLLAPMQLGPIFVPASEMEKIKRKNRKTGEMEEVLVFREVNGRRPTVLQADINAAINLGLRAIAAPDADDIHTRIRAERDGEAFKVRAENAREKARWKDKPTAITVAKESDRKKLLESARLNFFFDTGGVAAFDRATIENLESPVASGRGIWGSVNQSDWKRCEELNAARLARPRPGPDPGDDLPM
jgi:hypothetical protein